jgi:3-oxoacyl-[acyl-carrier-protein] synthase-3
MALKVLGCGMYLPKRVVTNDYFEDILDTNDEWIKSRTGISQRHFAEPGELSSDMAIQAAIDAIRNSGVSKEEVDLIICCTTTPDNSFPSVAIKIQAGLGLKNIPVFDLQAVCAGFVYGVQVADSMVKSGAYKTVLLVGAEKMSSLLDFTDRSTCVLFGDGAGAVILQHSDTTSGIIDSQIFSDGAYYDILRTDGGVGLSGDSGRIRMNGREVFRHAVEKMSDSILTILARNNIPIERVNYLVPHQANVRIINNIAQRLGFDIEKTIVTVDRHANCSAASIPLALAESCKNNRFREGDIIVLTALGAGVTWGACILRW